MSEIVTLSPLGPTELLDAALGDDREGDRVPARLRQRADGAQRGLDAPDRDLVRDHVQDCVAAPGLLDESRHGDPFGGQRLCDAGQHPGAVLDLEAEVVR